MSRPMTPTRRARLAAAAVLGLLVLAAAVLAWLLGQGMRTVPLPPLAGPPAEPAALVARGAWLARAANCLGCHSQPGRPAMSGGAPLATPFGQIVPGNLTPDASTGLGRWQEEDFRRALHQGVAPGGRLLYPAFPYPHFSAMQPEDARALWAWLRQLPPVVAAHPAAAEGLRWPYDQPWALALWRGLYFRPAAPQPRGDAAASRGAYLAGPLGHCGACHSSRTALGGPRDAARFDGEAMPDGSGWAPSLHRADEAGVQRWPAAEVVELLHRGESAHARVRGAMAEVVQQSTQHLGAADLADLAAWLQALPEDAATPPAPARPVPEPLRERGAALYRQHCVECHGEQGQGAPGRYPALAGNRLLTQDPAINLLRALLVGGFGPGTAARPRPFGMPPYGALMSDEELAAVASYLRSSWGHAAGVVDPAQVARVRAALR